mmetsp:Transcript_113093/g.359343  ORF Transcript_113093/g.359343 Transcript_113093/m.359343 type:complete len:297 (-) Transcript_113093:5592-6482(-)
MLRSWKLRPALARETHGRRPKSEAQTCFVASQASDSLNKPLKRPSPSRPPTTCMESFSALPSSGGSASCRISCRASSKIAAARSLEVVGCNRSKHACNFGNTICAFSGWVKVFCMQPYGKATAWGVRTSLGNFGANNARFKLLEPTTESDISSGVMHQLHFRSLVKFMLTSLVSPGLDWRWSWATSMLVRESFRMSFLSLLGRSARSTESVPSLLQRTSTHWPTSSASILVVISGSKHVASNIPAFRARTAQCERMSGAEAASRTSTPCTPTGTSSSPLTAPLRRIVGVSKILPCI